MSRWTSPESVERTSCGHTGHPFLASWWTRLERYLWTTTSAILMWACKTRSGDLVFLLSTNNPDVLIYKQPIGAGMTCHGGDVIR